MKNCFVFRRDLRLHDSTALNKAILSGNTLPVFIFDPRQIDSNEFRSDNALSFMIQSLKEVDLELRKYNSKLHVFYESPEKVITKLKEFGIECIYANQDYTPFAINRDQEILKFCNNLGIKFELLHDYNLTYPGQVLKSDGKPYTIYTPFYKTASKTEVRKPASLKNFKFILNDKFMSLDEINIKYSADNHQEGGRSKALSILSKISKFLNYSDERNIPSVTGTTRLSPHLKFGTVSIREAYHLVANSLGADSQLIKELYWRDFFSQIIYFFPHVLSGAFHKKYNNIQWDDNNDYFLAWCNGLTGYPIVDAGMRELNNTGFMHNRVRMIVASFLIKDLLLPWQWGEKYFAKKLVDYDPAINNGNWQWSASVGCDAAPYFRIFNPSSQQEKFDKDCIYIKKWIPELTKYSSKEIHDLTLKKDNYPMPIVEHSIQKVKVLALYSTN